MKPYENELLNSMVARIEEMGIGAQTTTARLAAQCGCEGEDVDMFGLDDALRKECARRGYRLDMSAHENMVVGLPYNLEFTVKALHGTSNAAVPPNGRGSIQRLELGWMCMVGSMVRDYAFQRREDGGYDVTVELVGEPSSFSGTMSRDEAESFDAALQQIGVLILQHEPRGAKDCGTVDSGDYIRVLAGQLGKLPAGGPAAVIHLDSIPQRLVRNRSAGDLL